VVAKHRFAKVLNEDAPDRAAPVEYAAVMTGAGPKLISFFGIIDQRAEKGRTQRLGVLPQTADQVLGNEVRGLFGEEDITVGFLKHIDRYVLQLLPAYQYDDGHV